MGEPPRPLVRPRCRSELVGVRPGPGQAAARDDEVLVADRTAFQPALENLAGAGSVTSLGGKGRSGDVRGHAVVRHGPPWMVRRSVLGEPDVARVPGELAALQRPDDGVAVGDLAPGGVDDIG